ncbi:hypothetical protein L208DRAFT_1425249 [Tricholoma matsutake]|nr:hypothetical protein L208DRAFT_1425249 [Tricholoma matsutake 945]
MDLPDVSGLSISGPNEADPESVEDPCKINTYGKSLPYAIEPCSKMLEMLDFIVLRLTQCLEARDYDVGLLQWSNMLTYWRMLKCPMPKDIRIKLAKVYFHVSTIPGMPTQLVDTCSDAFTTLTKSKKKLSINDMRLPWKPIYNILSEDLFLSRRQFEHTHLSWYMGHIADNARRFFHPAAIEEMLSTFVPLVDGSKLDSLLAPQYYLLTFLPLTHPQPYLSMLFRMWESINSYKYDERMLDFLSKLTEIHVVPEVSDPRKMAEIPDDERSEDEGRPSWSGDSFSDLPDSATWPGIYKDVGIFTEHEWHLVMCKCLASMEIPLADAGSLTTGPSADNEASFEIGRLPAPQWRISSLAHIIVYSMAPDNVAMPPSNTPTPLFSPSPSGTKTPRIHTTPLGEYLAAPLGRAARPNVETFSGGSKALDSLVRLIASTESFFHPSNSGPWTNDNNIGWYEEREPDCKTPVHRRLTKFMKRELVKSLRTVALLAMFSQDSTTVSNIQSALYSMSIMEPDLILYPILERAVPSLEAQNETQRTIAVIKALGAVAPAIVSREIYYPGAKYLVPILQLLIPGIDLNDPSKTLCTTSFLVDVSQSIKFGDLTANEEYPVVLLDSEPTLALGTSISPSLSTHEVYTDVESRLGDEKEDALLRDSTSSFPDWVANFICRVIQLLENLPDEGLASGATEGEFQVVDAVICACSQICIHLSAPLYDLVLNMIFDYTSTNGRPNAVQVIHQLVECVANANPDKALAKFLPFCSKNIRLELEHGASSVRTTSVSNPLPSDATLHWNLAILRGAIYKYVLKHKDELLELLRLLHNKTFSKRGYSWSGKMLSSVLLTLTKTYPLEDKFANPQEWNSDEFCSKHHRHWGKLYKQGELSWHVPSDDEIGFAIRIFEEIVEPTLAVLEGLVLPVLPFTNNVPTRHLSFVRNGFSGIPTLVKEIFTPNELSYATSTSDILDEIPEMIAPIENVEAGFCLTNIADPRFRYITSLKRRFGIFLHSASVNLRLQSEENVVDVVDMLIRAVRTYMLEYGESKDSYFLNDEQYRYEKNAAHQYAHQKVWPRTVHVSRARYYHSSRLRWNSIERRRGALEDSLIDELVEWSLWRYAVIRRTSQSLLDSICEVYDGVRRRALPVLFESLEQGTDDDRMKGALWTVSSNLFGGYAVSEPKLALKLAKSLFSCQANENPSIQNHLSILFDVYLDNLTEPCFLVYDVPTPSLEKALSHLRLSLKVDSKEDSLVLRCREKRLERVRTMNEVIKNCTAAILEVANSPQTHWRYVIFAIRCLITLVRRDFPSSSSQTLFFLEKTYDDHPTIRYYAQQAIMKIARYIKHRTFCKTSGDLALMRGTNPLKRSMVIEPSLQIAPDFLAHFRKHFDMKQMARSPVFCDKDPPGWIAWRDSISLYIIPDSKESTFQSWDPSNDGAVVVLHGTVTDSSYWEQLAVYYSEENHETTIKQDNVSCVKSIFQILEDEPFEALRPTMEKMIADKDRDPQRAAAELIAGVIGGSKHWPPNKRRKLWEWFNPFVEQIFRQNITTDTLMIWTSFLEYIFYHTDPRRVQPLVDYIFQAFICLDYNAEMAFDATKVLSLFRACYEQLGRKFLPWTDDVISQCWTEIDSEHDEVRGYIGELLAFSEKIKWQPKPSFPTTEVFVNECRTRPLDFDIMNIRGVYHKERILELVDRFQVWHRERVPGVRAFQCMYDRVGITVCKWLYQSLHDVHAISTFDYILSLMPELFRFTEVHDNDELASRASTLMVQMCGVTPPLPLVNPILDAIFQAIRSSPVPFFTFHVTFIRMAWLPVFYFRQVPLISEVKIIEILEVLCRCLDDEVVEVREMAATTLSGILRLSPRRSMLTLKARFVRLAKNTHIPDRQHAGYNKAIRQRHAAILGICALVDSYPYTVEKWMPDLLANVLAEHTYDPAPISTTVRKCASNFKKTHQDTWHEDSKRFDDDQLAALSTLLTGSSYC